MTRNEAAWKKWIDENEPEKCPVPDGYEEKLSTEGGVGQFQRLCLVRALREDRTMVTADMFIADVLGPEYIKPVTDQITSIYEESNPNTPVLYLLTAGADPTANIEELCRKKKLPHQPSVTSMGEGQEVEAQAAIETGFVNGQWVILSNSHLAIEYMAEMEHILNPKDKTINENFRLWITCEATKEFPLGLLQMAIKVTIEPPKGLKAGLHKTFNTMVNQDFLEKVEPYERWRSIVFTICFLHSIVQERRKFCPLGFCKAYEFNTADLSASLDYCEGHMNKSTTLGLPYSWAAMQYMVTQVQYGGRITDAEDNIMFDTYGKLWVNSDCLQQNYCFNQAVTEFVYMVPDVLEHTRFLDYIDRMPPSDSPPIFGLHPNADLTFRKNESLAMINTLIETMPKDDGGGSGKSFEQEVMEKVEKEMLPSIPADMVWIEIQERLKVLKGPRGLVGSDGKYHTIPLNIFLSQELQRMQGMLTIVKNTLNNIVQAIQGNIIMSPQIVDAINAVGEMRIPTTWLVDPSGAEISWLAPNLGAWIKSMIDRHHQMWSWVSKERPVSFWLTGFFNPQGFLTAMKQEVTRQKKQLNWALDEVSYWTEPLREFVPGEDGRIENRTFSNPPSDGVLIHGLFLEGAGWHKTDKRLDESEPKILFTPFPVMHVTAVSTAPPPDARAGQ
jgi:dynein heavy chain